MDKLWILTEEKPKISVINEILRLYCQDFQDKGRFSKELKIYPIFCNGKFQFCYTFEGVKLEKCSEIVLLTVSGTSSFFDFLVFKQANKPDGTNNDNLLMAIEETKTSGEESRNTGVYQRGSKFVFIENYYKQVKKYMLYNEELEGDETKKPADTITFGTNMFLSLGVEIVGKETGRWFSKFNSVDELIAYKNSMRKPPAGNVPVNISKYDDRIEISGRLAKPADKGNIGHDPNIGALSMIAGTLRHFGWNKDIVITCHGVTQEYIDRTRGNNKFLYICKILNLKMQGLVLPQNIVLPKRYWYYEKNSEKVASILLHILAENNGMRAIYQNHAGCERGYFITKDHKYITLPKKDENNINLYIPDLVLHSPAYSEILVIEGKKLATIEDGLEEIEDYDSIENEYIREAYPECKIYRYLSIYGGNLTVIPNKKVLFYLSENGSVYMPEDLPESFKAGNFALV